MRIKATVAPDAKYILSTCRRVMKAKLPVSARHTAVKELPID